MRRLDHDDRLLNVLASGWLCALAAVALVATGCDRETTHGSRSLVVSPEPRGPADDPRVACPPGTIQKRYEGGPARALSIWCVDADGQKHGPDKTWFLDTGKISEGNYNHGASDGIQREWYAEGALESEAQFANGVEEGQYRSWHPNGRPSFVLEYRGGQPVGVARWWDEQGRLVKTKKYGGSTAGDRPSADRR